MEIGIVGLGVVGSAIRQGFLKLGHNVKRHDIKLDTRLDDLCDTDMTFICLPTPQMKDSGHANVGIVKDVVRCLVHELDYRGIVVIKSTVEPGTTEALIKEKPESKICMVPEFLRERCAVYDFVDNHELCVIGTHDGHTYDVVKRAHGHYPQHFVRLSPTEAEISKYFNNSYNAMKITFANVFYEICKKTGADYAAMKDAIVKRKGIEDHYLDCNEVLRGFGGVCLPKDVRAISALAEDMGLEFDLLKTISSDNDKCPISPL